MLLRGLNTSTKLFTTRKMSQRAFLDASPPIYSGSKGTLDKSAFRKSLDVLAAKVPAAQTGILLKADPLKRSIMDLPKVRSVVVDPSDPVGSRLILLRVSKEAELTPEALSFLKLQSNGLVMHTINLDYDYWTADEILQTLLPEELRDGSPTGFAATGHIAHLNLNDEYLPYKHVIGQLILDKNKRIKTVVNKLDTIHSQFRFFEMELIAGEPNYVVEHHESDCRFTFDFSLVYWNSRLHTEHDRLVQMFDPQDVIADVFAGVGPFAIPAAKKGCAVFANDLNPNSTKYLSVNVQNNKVNDLVRVFCEDGRDFIRSIARRAFEDPFAPITEGEVRRKSKKPGSHTGSKIIATGCALETAMPRNRISAFVMNLPDSAIQFLDAFRGILAPDGICDLRQIYDVMPIVHCYCFTRELEPSKAKADISNRVAAKLGSVLTDDVNFYLVRSVAPNKNMYCISFRLPPVVAFAQN